MAVRQRALFKGEEEGRAAADRGVSPDSSTMPAYGAVDSRQADARTGELVLGVQPFEWAKDVVDVGHVEAGAVVAHVVHDLLASRLAREVDLRVRLIAGELEGITQQVGECDPHEIRI